MVLIRAILVLSFSAVLAMLQAGNAFSQSDTCQPHTVCAHPGDLLKYAVTVRDSNSSENYDFADMSDANNIKVVQSVADAGGVKNATLILNLSTGLVHSEQDLNTTRPFLEILPSPIEYNKSDSSITPITTKFNGFKRTVLEVFHSSENTTSKIEYDVDTGILLEERSTSIVTIRGNPVLVDFSDRLIDTNMINSDSNGTQSQISIPKWVKNTARSWSHGDIQDSEFTGAVQYLISNGVMHVPHGASGASSSQSIPTWIKRSTNMWAEGQITDNEFVQGVQWLISNGIIQVKN